MTTNQGIFIIYGRGDYFDNTSRNEQRDAGLFEFGLTVGDFNSDGRTNFAAVEVLNKRLRVHLNGASAASPIVYEAGIYSEILASADINGNGKLDLLISDSRVGDFQTFYGTGSGTFGNPEIIPINLPVSDVALADYDGDGKADLAVARNGNWYLNRTTQGFVSIQFGTTADLPVPNAFVR